MSDTVPTLETPTDTMRPVFVFPGQGAQSVGMGRDLYENSPAARAVFDNIDVACGFLVSQMCFSGTDAQLRETQNAQLALFAVSAAALAACREAGLEPSAVAGHSVGEYAALLAAGVFDVQTGAALVQARGAAMAAAAKHPPGTMAAVLGMEMAVVIESCQQVNNVGVVVAANHNAPGQIVISGETPAVEAVSVLLKEKGAKRIVPLSVAGAFHSPLMEPAAVVLENMLAKVEFQPPHLPFIANVTADYVRDVDLLKQHLVAQVAGSVRWVETIERFTRDGKNVFVECGAGSVLAGLIRRIALQATVFSVGDVDSLRAAMAGVRK